MLSNISIHYTSFSVFLDKMVPEILVTDENAPMFEHGKNKNETLNPPFFKKKDEREVIFF